jgi:Uma2 family endonuclease
MAIAPPRYTEQDLEDVRDSTTDRVELLEGEIVVTPSPSPRHQDIVGNLYILFRNSIRDAGLGSAFMAPLDVVLSEGTIVQPDVVVVLADRRLVLTEKRIEGTPSLVVEVISPTTGVRDVVDKRRIYARHRVPEYWLVDPAAFQVTVFTDPRDDQYFSQETVIDALTAVTMPGVATTVADVFSAGPDF